MIGEKSSSIEKCGHFSASSVDTAIRYVCLKKKMLSPSVSNSLDFQESL